MIPFPNKKYKIIYADPAWRYKDKALAGDRGAGCKYDTMIDEEIKQLPVERLAEKDCFLFMWATWPKLPEQIQVIKSWGFQYKTLGFLWVKTNVNNAIKKMNMGGYTRSNSEPLLLGIKGNPQVIRHDVKQVYTSIQLEHSEKPNEFRNRIIQLCGDLPRIELFARTKVHGWNTWGNDEKLKLEPLESY